MKKYTLTDEHILELIADAYHDGFARCSFGLDMDFEYSTTKLRVERENKIFNGGVKIADLEVK